MQVFTVYVDVQTAVQVERYTHVQKLAEGVGLMRGLHSSSLSKSSLVKIAVSVQKRVAKEVSNDIQMD